MTRVTQYLVTLATGFAVGWILQTQLFPATSFPPATETDTQAVSNPKPAEAVVAKSSVIGETAVSDTQTSSTTENNSAQQEAEWSSFSLIEELANLSEQEFEKLLYELARDEFQLSKTQVFRMLEDLHSITDPATRNRLIQYLGASRFHRNGADFDPHGMERWVIDQVQELNQRSEWLEVLSYWGTHYEDSTRLLVESLDQFSETERVSAMLALSRNLRVILPEIAASKSEFAEQLFPYLDSENELERAAALRALSPYADNLNDTITAALADDSEAMRLSALWTMLDRHRINTDEIKDLLVSRMQSESASALERVRSYSALQLLPVEGRHYEAVYEFRLGHAHRLTQQMRRENPGASSPWM